MINENRHTAPTYNFATYCETVQNAKRKNYFNENFNIEDRAEIFGPHNGCDGECAGTGWIPVSKSDMGEPLRSLWVQAEVDSPAEDGWHLIPCPKCSPTTNEGIDEHIVRRGNTYEMVSRTSGAKMSQIQLAKRLKDDLNDFLEETDSDSTGSNKDKTGQEHDDAKKKADNNRDSDSEKKKKSKEKRQEKEKERKEKKLLPYEFVSQKEAERSGGHLGVHGSHTTGNGIYKPGSSDYTLRDAVARKKAKQQMKGGHFREETDETLDKANLPEMVRIIKATTK